MTRHADVASLCHAQNVLVILHDEPFRNDTIRLGLDEITHNSDINGCLFCPGDQPLLSRETIINLIDAFLADNKKIIRPAFQNTPGAPVLFPSWAFSELFSLPEGKGGGFVAKKYPERIQLVPVQDEYELKDVDTQKDLLILLNRFKYQLM